MAKAVVLDTTIIVKALVAPFKRLPPPIYDREFRTHEKCKIILRQLEEMGREVFIPAVCIIETASAIRRLTGDRTLAELASARIKAMYEVIGEDIIFDRAWEIALQTGASGFDTYFIATADVLNAVLITDDASMANKAREIGIATLLVREVGLEKLINYLRDPPP